MMQTASTKSKEGTCEDRSFFGKEVVSKPRWDHRFRIGDVARTVGGGGPYNRGEIVEIAEKERYYGVDYGLGFPSLIREENLEPFAFDPENPLSEPPRSFVPPTIPFVGAADKYPQARMASEGNDTTSGRGWHEKGVARWLT